MLCWESIEKKMGDLKKEDVEKYLENNPQFAKEYFDRKLKSEAVSTLCNHKQQDLKDGVSFQELGKLEEAEILMEALRETEDASNVEKAIHKVLQRLALLIQASYCSFFIYRSRNGIPELATRLFNVTKDSKYEDNFVTPEGEIVFPLDIGIVGWTAHTKKTFNVPDVKKVGGQSKTNTEID